MTNLSKKFIYIFLKQRGNFAEEKEEEGGKKEKWIQANVFLVDLTGFCTRL